MELDGERKPGSWVGRDLGILVENISLPQLPVQREASGSALLADGSKNSGMLL